MKKRIVSLLMTALMLVSLVPAGAMAAADLSGIGDIIGGGSGSGSTVTVSFTKQPQDVTVNAGETATFTVEAKAEGGVSIGSLSLNSVKYIWVDADKLVNDSVVSTLLSGIGGSGLGSSKTLTIENASADDNGKQFKCIAYSGSLSGSSSIAYAVSDTAKLTVTGGTTPAPTASPSVSPSPSASPSIPVPSIDIPIPSTDPGTCTHKNAEHHEKSDGTCDPHIEYWYCTDCGKYFTDSACTQQISKAKLDNGLTKDKNNHSDLRKLTARAATCTEEGNVMCWYCSGCDKYFSDARAANEVSRSDVIIDKTDHDYSWEANSDGQTHYKKCLDCGKTGATGRHSGGTASCTAQAECEKCGAGYGEPDKTNHVNFTYKNAVKASGTTQGYTGDKYCADCGAFIEKGEYYYEQCAGGCKELKLVKGTPKTCTADGTIDYYQCTKCKNKYRDAKGTIDLTNEDLVDKCTGHDLHPGTSLIGSINRNNLKQTALSFGMSLQDIAQMMRDGSFSFDDIIASTQIKDIDHCSDDTHHWLGCQRCGKTLEDLRDELEGLGLTVDERIYALSRKTAHSGGTATCQSKAICDECGDGYGKLGEHRYKAVVTAPTCTKDGYTTYTCATCKDSYKDNTTVKTGHIIEYGRCQSCKGRFQNPFYDVEGTDWYYSPIMWAYYSSPQVTTGTGGAYFSPKASCTRAQVVTFLWRAAGRPEPGSGGRTFADVPNNDRYAYCYKAVRWAAEKGITTGTGDGSVFSPDKTVTRAEFVTFLWRYAGSPSPKNLSSSFTDIDSGQFYYKAVVWAAENGVTTGASASSFAPAASCTRAEVVTFLFRAFSKGVVN